MERYRIHPDAAVYFLTYSIVEWLPLFVTEATFRIVADSLTVCHEKKHLRVNAFVIMPTHMHAILFDESYDVDRLRMTLADFRKFTGRQLSDYCQRHFPPCFHETLCKQATADRERRLWQPSRHPEAIQQEAFWQQKLDYLHDNPRRKGLVLNPADGDGRRRDGTCRKEKRHATCRLRRLRGKSVQAHRRPAVKRVARSGDRATTSGSLPQQVQGGRKVEVPPL